MAVDRRTDVRMPQLGESVTEGTIVSWLVSVGDHVSVDDPLCEVSTDKVDSEIPCPVDGQVIEILVPEGETVTVGSPMVGIGTASTELPDRDSVPANGVAAGNGSTVGATGDVAPSTTRASRIGPDGSFRSPAVRARLAERPPNDTDVVGTGHGGRITLRDLDEPADPVAVARAGESSVPFTPIRRRTAAHMVESLSTSAHTLVVMETDYLSVDLVRQRHKESFRRRHGVGLTYLSFVAHAVVTAVRDFPRVNARVGVDELLIRDDVNLGIAVDLDHEGLVVPVVRHAETLRLGALAVAIAHLAEKAQAGSLTPDDVSGGTFTITNAGAYGTLVTSPIIYQPQVAILSTDGVSVQPVAVAQPDGQHALGFHPIGNLCLSFDHRAFDGAYASAFLDRVRTLIQESDWETAL